MEIERNEKGEAIINLYSREGLYLAETIISEETWIETNRYSWHLRDDGYVEGYLNGENILLHVYLYTRYKGGLKWGGTNGKIKQSYIRANTLEEYKKITIQLLNEEKK